MEMTAIAFASPGIGVAEALLFGQDMKSTNRLTSITVQPQNDIVSRIDSFQRNEMGCRLLYNVKLISYRETCIGKMMFRLHVLCSLCSC